MSAKRVEKLINKGRRGFTLIELLVVIAVIGVLASIALVNLNGVQVSARNAVRKSDLAQLRDAVKRYHLITGNWPTSAVGPEITTACANPGGTDGDWPTDLKNEFAAIGIPKLPVDPLFNGGSITSKGDCDTGSPTHLYYGMGCLSNGPGTQCSGNFVVEIHIEGTSDPDYKTGAHNLCGWDNRHYEQIVGSDPAC